MCFCPSTCSHILFAIFQQRRILAAPAHHHICAYFRSSFRACSIESSTLDISIYSGHDLRYLCIHMHICMKFCCSTSKRSTTFGLVCSFKSEPKIENLVIGVSSNSNSKRNGNDSSGGGVVSAQMNTNKVSNTQKYSEKSENYKQLTMKSFKNTTLRYYYIFCFQHFGFIFLGVAQSYHYISFIHLFIHIFQPYFFFFLQFNVGEIIFSMKYSKTVNVCVLIDDRAFISILKR